MPKAISEAVRFVFFETNLECFRYATNGGTAFIVKYRNKPYAITCRHVLKGFQIDDLVITDATLGRRIAAVKGVHCAIALKDGAEGSDIEDVCVIDFKDFDASFFDGYYDLDRFKAASSEPANRLVVTGFLKQKSFIDPPNIFPGLAFLHFTDAGVSSFDHAVRRGLATYAAPGFDNFSGISGGPVYNTDSGALCGMVTRGGMHPDGSCTVYFIDIFDIVHFLDAAAAGFTNVSYQKPRPIL